MITRHCSCVAGYLIQDDADGGDSVGSILSRSFNCDHNGYLDNFYMSIQELTTPTKECALPRARFWVSPHQLRPTDG